jgi:hypothetical protein
MLRFGLYSAWAAGLVTWEMGPHSPSEASKRRKEDFHPATLPPTTTPSRLHDYLKRLFSSENLKELGEHWT